MGGQDGGPNLLHRSGHGLERYLQDSALEGLTINGYSLPVAADEVLLFVDKVVSPFERTLVVFVRRKDTPMTLVRQP